MLLNNVNHNKNIKQISWYGDKTFPFSVEEAVSKGTVVTGVPKSGKTNLAKMIVDYLMTLGYNVKVLDPSQAWLHSTVPYYVVLDSWMDITKIPNPTQKSIVYDISRMYPEEQKLFTGMLIDTDFEYLSNIPNLYVNFSKIPNWWIIYVIEEAQMVVPSGSLRASYAQQTFRMVSVGRNFLQRYMLLTQRPADISVKAISRSGQNYFGFHFEENDIRKLSRTLGWKFLQTKKTLENLKIGEFIYFNPYQKVKIKIESPEFKSCVEQKNLLELDLKPKQKGWLTKILDKL